MKQSRWTFLKKTRPTRTPTGLTRATNLGSCEVFLFAKAPRAGAVKTRLARDIGTIKAAFWYRRTLARTILVVVRAGIPGSISAAPSATTFLSAFKARCLPVCDQPTGNLGRRMASVARRAASACVVVGTDIPALEPSALRAAAAALSRADVVFGPATDGGYYLVGLKSGARAFRLFDRVRWSSPYALADTLRNAPGHWRIALLPMLSDVDDVFSLEKVSQPPARALVMTTSSSGRSLCEENSAGRTAVAL